MDRKQTLEKLVRGEPLKVLFLNDLGFQYGAGIASQRQIRSLLELGHEVAGLCCFEGIEEGALPFAFGPGRARWQGMEQLTELQPGMQVDEDALIHTVFRNIQARDPDLIIAGNLHGTLWPVKILWALRDLRAVTVAYMHDLYLVTGRCAYPGGCSAFMSGCDQSCPTPTEHPALEPEKIAAAWRERRHIFCGTGGVALATNSHWTLSMARAALAEPYLADAVPLGLDTHLFRPMERRVARELLGLPQDRFIALIGAVNHDDLRKGPHFSETLIKSLPEHVDWLFFGEHSLQIKASLGLPHVHATGLIRDIRRLPLLYNAADIFVGASLEEAFGQTYMEAAACGIPSVAFRVGGIPEVARHGSNARLVDGFSAAGLIEGIEFLRQNPQARAAFGRSGRSLAVAEFSLEAQGKRWTEYLCGLARRKLASLPTGGMNGNSPARRERNRWLFAVHSAGKVGSTSIVAGLAEAGFGTGTSRIFQTHLLNPKTLEGAYRRNPMGKGHLDASHQLLDLMQAGDFQHCMVIAGQRDPVAQSISIFFQNWSKYFGDRAPRECSPELVLEKLHQNLPRLTRYIFDWWKGQYEEVFDVSLAACDFDRARGLAVVHTEHKRTLVIYNLERGMKHLPAVLAQLTGLRALSIPRVNTVADRSYFKEYGSDPDAEGLYQTILETFRLSEDRLDTIYRHPVSRTFYDDEQTTAFKNRWVRRPGPSSKRATPAHDRGLIASARNSSSAGNGSSDTRQRDITCISYPRSGHHLLVQLLLRYYARTLRPKPNQFVADGDGGKGYARLSSHGMSYCEYYGHCRSIPCTDPSTNFQKNHDFGLDLPDLPNCLYIVQYRYPLDSVVSYFEFKHAIGHIKDSPEAWLRFSWKATIYWQSFIRKWVHENGTNKLFVSYKEILRPDGSCLKRVLEYLRPDEDIDIGFIKKCIKQKTGAVKARNIQEFRYFEHRHFQRLEALVRAEIEDLGFKLRFN